MRLRMKKREVREHVTRRARELAESGRFERWSQIEFELRFKEGFPEARTVLGDDFIRDELDSICQRVRAKVN